MSKSRHAKKIRIEGGTGENKRIKFDDDGEEVGTVLDAASSNEAVSRDKLESNHEEYMRKVRERLAASKDLDAADAKERIREKHRKKRMQERGEQDNDEDVVDVELGKDNSDSDSDSSDVHESGESDDDEVDIKDQEELALSMIRGS